MAEAKSINPKSLARQTRERAVRQIEENYKNSLNAAAKAREDAVREAIAAKAEAVKMAQIALDEPKKRLSEARDRIENRLRKQELNEARRTQEQMLIQSENTRTKALKQAEELGKHLANEAAETRRHAIQRAYDSEKKFILEARQALQTQKDTARSKMREERQAEQKKKEEPTEAKTRAHKAIATERSVPQAIANTKGKALKEESNPAKSLVKPESASKPINIDKEALKKSPEPVKNNEPALLKSRTGMVKLIISLRDSGPQDLTSFENSLRKIPDLRLVMVGGTTKEGAEIIVNADKSVALFDLLKQMPIVEEVNDRHSDILVKLKAGWYDQK
jgi:hypothetical protein